MISKAWAQGRDEQNRFPKGPLQKKRVFRSGQGSEIVTWIEEGDGEKVKKTM